MELSSRWLAGVALLGTVASVLAAGVVWLALTRPEAAAAMLGAWSGLGR